MHNHGGFTLIELLVVISIIGVLSSVVLASVVSAREKARIARAQEDLKEFQKASFFLEADTGVTIGGFQIASCAKGSGDDEFRLDGGTPGKQPDKVGLVEGKPSKFPNWDGPYIHTIPPDPWGNPYYFDDDFNCTDGATGCVGFPTSGELLRVVYSGGQNGSVENQYDADNVVQVLCRR